MAGIDAKPELLRWAINRSRRPIQDVSYGPTRNLPAWLDGTTKPTLRQLEAFAKRTYTSFGLLLLDEPIEDKPPWTGPTNPSGPLIDFAHQVDGLCEEIRDLRAGDGARELPFVGQYHKMADALTYLGNFLTDRPGWRKAAAITRENAETAKVVVFAPKQNWLGAPLDPFEFSGVVSANGFAPTVGINGNSPGHVQFFALCVGLVAILMKQSGMIHSSGRHMYGASRDDAGSAMLHRVMDDYALTAREAIRRDLNTAALHHMLDTLLDAQNVSRSPMGWPAVSDILADEVLRGARSGALTYRDAWNLIGVKTFREAEARHERSKPARL